MKVPKNVQEIYDELANNFCESYGIPRRKAPRLQVSRGLDPKWSRRRTAGIYIKGYRYTSHGKRKTSKPVIALWAKELKHLDTFGRIRLIRHEFRHFMQDYFEWNPAEIDAKRFETADTCIGGDNATSYGSPLIISAGANSG